MAMAVREKVATMGAVRTAVLVLVLGAGLTGVGLATAHPEVFDGSTAVAGVPGFVGSDPDFNRNRQWTLPEWIEEQGDGRIGDDSDRSPGRGDADTPDDVSPPPALPEFTDEGIPVDAFPEKGSPVESVPDQGSRAGEAFPVETPDGTLLDESFLKDAERVSDTSRWWGEGGSPRD